jgi:hypothetical protein
METKLNLNSIEKVIWRTQYEFVVKYTDATHEEAIKESDQKILNVREMSDIIDKSGYRY